MRGGGGEFDAGGNGLVMFFVAAVVLPVIAGAVGLLLVRDGAKNRSRVRIAVGSLLVLGPLVVLLGVLPRCK